eukprot:GHVL01037586.1.p1 GENE.GHVL01037586.1~~GHVL01037586.1.p1  ORF type:complete len:848 (+),score=195.25 GHVL01037586.1:1461-4004(+)
MSTNEFVIKSKNLLKYEEDEEREQVLEILSNCPNKELQARGIVLLKLTLDESTRELNGRMIGKFIKENKEKLPSHRISSGDIVGVFDTTSSFNSIPIIEGVVNDVKNNHICVVFDDDLDEIPSVFNLSILVNRITFDRYKHVLEELEDRKQITAQNIVDICFDGRHPRVNEADIIQPDFEIRWKSSPNLNDSQKAAVELCLNATDICLVHGPPGTGKTTTLVEAIRQLVLYRKCKVLCCCPSNVAVDNVVERISKHKAVRTTRMGHPARIQKNLQQFSIDDKMAKSDTAKLCKDIHSELNAIGKKCSSKKITKSERYGLKAEAKALRSELSKREKKALGEVIDNTDVLVCTCVGAGGWTLRQYLKKNSKKFDVVCIDEAAQALEVACWIPILLGNKCILAGDHFQLPPTIKSKSAKELSITLFERLEKLQSINQWTPPVTCLLNVQYRMNKDIMQWSNETFYDSKLVAHNSVTDHTLADFMEPDNHEFPPMVLIDSDGISWMCEDPLQTSVKNESRSNYGEAAVLVVYLEQLLTALNKKISDSTGSVPGGVSVITPYNCQVDVIRQLIDKRVDELINEHNLSLVDSLKDVSVNTVDSYQGRESETVIVSLVRSNFKREIGFLGDLRRLNVAVTRAKRHLCLIGDSQTLSVDPDISRLLEIARERGVVRYPSEFISELNIGPAPVKQNAIIKTDKKRTEKKKKNKKPIKNENEDDTEKITDIRCKDEGREEEIRSIIDDVQNGKLLSYSFPSTYNSFERRLIHTICESYGLTHVSLGEDDQRYTYIENKSNKTKSDPEKIKTTNIDVYAPNDFEEEEENDKSEDEKSEKNRCIPKPNKKKKKKKKYRN